MNIFLIMAVSLSGTIIIECIGAWLLKIRDKYDLLNVLLVNVLTNPLVVSVAFVINVTYGLFYRHIAMIFLELGAFVIEGFIYCRNLQYKKLNGFIISFILNITSFSLGIIINKIVW